MSHEHITFDDEATISRAVDMMMATRPAGDATPPRVTILGAAFGTPASYVLHLLPKARLLVVEPNIEELHEAARLTGPGATYARYGIAEAPLRIEHQYGKTELLMYCASEERAEIVRDLRAWLPWCERGAVIWVHGFTPPPQTYGLPDTPGIALAVGDLVAANLIVEVARPGGAWIGFPAREVVA